MKLPATINGHDRDYVVQLVNAGYSAGEVAGIIGVKASTMTTYISGFRSLGLISNGDGAHKVVRVVGRSTCANPRCRKPIAWEPRLCFSCRARRRR